MRGKCQISRQLEMSSIMMKKIAAFAVGLWLSVGAAFAQTSPNLTFGQVLTPAQWNQLFINKQDYLGAAPLLITGGNMTGPLVTASSTAGVAGFSILPGTAPTSPVNGNMWMTAAGLFAQVNGGTVGPFASATGGTISNLVVTGSFTAIGLVTNADLANASTTVNGQTCTLGGACTITASAGTISIGTTTVASGTSGYVLTNNAGVLGNIPTTGAGNVALSISPSITTAALSTPTITTPILSGTVTGTYSLGGSPSIPGSAINSGTISGSFMSSVNLAASGNGGVTGITPIANGGTGQATATLAIAALLPTPTRAGDVVYWTGTAWALLAGNNSGTQVLQENASGAPSWATLTGTGTVTSVTLAAGSGIALSGTNPITSTGTITISGAVPSPQGRITLAANTPVMGQNSCSGSPCANQGTLRYDCYVGGQVPYYNGSVDLIDTISSCEVTDAMVSAASAGQVVGSQVYDVWWVHSGTNRICMAMSSATGGGGGWASDTGGSNAARGTGYSQLDFVTRSYVTNKNSIANCFNGSTNYGSVAANQATYLGTVFATNNGLTAFQFGAITVGGTPGVLGVWNYYNRVDVVSTTGDATTSWTYGTATFRPLNNSIGNRTSFVSGMPLDGILVSGLLEVNTPSSPGSGTEGGVCLDGTSCISANIQGIFFNQLSSSPVTGELWYSGGLSAQTGFHFVQTVEYANAGTYTAFNLNNMTVKLRM
jgi:hypothetical protein